MSNTSLKKLNYSVDNYIKMKVIGKSHSTKHTIRERMFGSMKDLNTLNYPIKNISNLKGKHIDALVKYWQEKELSIGSIKNRLSDFRLYANLSNRVGIVKEKNSEYGIANRSYTATVNKAINEIDLNKFDDKYLRASLELQKEFGLRREECMKIIPEQALCFDNIGNAYLILKGSWTKGGVGRRINITNEAQLRVIEKAKSEFGNKSLIPIGKNYIQQRRLYDKVTREQGYYNLHGLRHAYAQRRYKEITGWNCPIAGGTPRFKLNTEQRVLDDKARLCISQELGHSRATITKNYIG